MLARARQIAGLPWIAKKVWRSPRPDKGCLILLCPRDSSHLRGAHLAAAAAHWQMRRIAPEVVERCRLTFPAEPVRTLEAIHLASALLGRTAIAGLQLLSLDDRMRRNGRALGFTVLPP